MFQQKDADHYELLGKVPDRVLGEDWRPRARLESLLCRGPA